MSAVGIRRLSGATRRSYRVFGNRGLKAMERLMGMVLICISVQMLLNAFAHILH